MVNRRSSPLYKVWRPDVGETEDTAREYAAHDVPSAAAAHSRHCHYHLGGWEWSWPITFHVKDPTNDRTYSVEVEREMIPEFVPGKAVVLR